MIVILIIIGVIFLAIMSMGSSTVTATGTATGTAKGTGTSTETASEPPAPKKMATTYSLYSKKPFWDSNRDKIDCENARGRDIKGNNGDYANYCIFTGADAEVNAQNACTSSDECVGYVGVEGSKNMFQLTSMPKADSDATSTRRFYVRTPLPPSRKDIVLPVAGFYAKRTQTNRTPPPPQPPRPHHLPYHRQPPPRPHPNTSRRKGFTNERPDIYMSDNPGYHSDIQALGGHPHMNLV
jgi:hypothetical protein